jgi:hypothetical protein
VSVHVALSALGDLLEACGSGDVDRCLQIVHSGSPVSK